MGWGGGWVGWGGACPIKVFLGGWVGKPIIYVYIYMCVYIYTDNLGIRGCISRACVAVGQEACSKTAHEPYNSGVPRTKGTPKISQNPSPKPFEP